MKLTVRVMTSVLVISLMQLVLANDNPLKAQEPKDSSRIYVKVRVDGLACPFCAYGVEKKIKKLEGAKHYDVNIEKGLVYFDLPKGKHSSEEKLKTAIRKKVNNAGFTPRKVNLRANPFDKPKQEE